MSTERGRRTAAAYLVAQGILTIAWWGALAALPDVRARFELGGQRRALDAFLLADAVTMVGGSLASARLLWRQSPWATLATSFTAGGAVYATLLLTGWVVIERSGTIGLPPMVVASAASTLVAIGSRRATRDEG